MRVYRVDETSETGRIAIYDIMEATYTGQDMGKRMITAVIKHPTPIDFKIGDYVEFSMQSLLRNGNHGEIMEPAERFYIYTEPQCKKTARSMSAGDAFEITVNFYPRQYELTGIQMRDFIQQGANSDLIIYTGFDTVTFYGGARELLDRCMACLAQHYKDDQGHPLWSYVLDDSLNEDKNNALERYTFSFQGNSVMDALLKLNDKDYINTTFFINDRTIYVGFKRPFLCAVDSAQNITDKPLELMYGKTSHMPIDLDHGGLYDITKSVGEELPITKLFAYGAARNLNRYYCADRIKSGRFVNKLMLPSFSDDGETDYIISEDGVKKYGVREGSKDFEEIYPSLRYMTYADIRGIKYCIKVKTSGLESDQFKDGKMDHTNDESRAKRPLARVQCYKVTPCTGENGDGTVGVNKLVECAPPEDLAVFIHATGKTVKVVLMADKDGQTSIQRQLAHDFGIVPVRTYGGTDYIPGSCFCVHDVGFSESDPTKHYTQQDREDWFNAEFRRFNDSDSLYAETPEQQVAELHRIEYVDTFWLTDLYVMEYENGEAMYDAQRHFSRAGYSAWAWPRLNNESVYPETLPVNEVVGVEPIVIADTSENIDGGRQQHWDIYLRDIGFAIDEQNDFGEMVFVFSTPVVSVLDGTLAGREFTIDGGENLNDFQDRVVCAYNEDGTFNHDFMFPGDSGDAGVASKALMNGAIWRIRLNRNDNDSQLSSIGLVLPNTDIAMKAGNHIVLLDIYMPDIYIRAAEQRLLREAQWFLEKNDRANVKYSINFDKVRFNQIQSYSRQMREGLMLRMVDEDLNITSENTTRLIVDHAVPNENQVPMYVQEEVDHIDEPRNTTYTFYKKNSDGEPKSGSCIKREMMGSERPGYSKLSFSIPKLNGLAKYAYMPAGQTETTDGSGISIWEPYHSAVPFDNFKLIDMIDRYHVEMQILNSGAFGGVLSMENITVNVRITEKVSWAESVKTYPETGTFLPAICRDYVHFKAGKFYDVLVDLNEESYAGRSWFWLSSGTHGSGESAVRNDQIFLTTSPQDIETRYTVPQFTKTFVRNMGGGMRRWKFSFYLPDSFNEIDGYYVAFLYATPDNTGTTKTDFGRIRMVSVTEKDLDAQGNVVNYVDFLVKNISIKIQDNTRPDDTRIMGSYPEPIFEINAQIEEQTKASAWGSLMNSVEKTRIESEQQKRTYEMLAQAARLNYQNLLNLKNNIFDPDGTCNDVFLQVMMLQVGADSMNYQLDYTFTTPTGVMSNFDVARKGGVGNQYFMVRDDDVLHHFVYTQGAGNAGTWQIPGNFEAELAPEGEGTEQTWPTYYVCIRCKRDIANDMTEPAWICSTKQYAVNDEEDTDYWYFNWGILTADSNGNYTLQETRGNAYMYGDNIIAGKISTIAGNSYFDLTHGNFVLSNGDETDAALSYINGVLTIKGLSDEDGIGKIIKDLGLEVENMEIGGENLSILEGGKYEESTYFESGGGLITKYIELLPTGVNPQGGGTIRTYLEAGKYIFSAKEVNCLLTRSGGIPAGSVSVTLEAIDRNGNIQSETIGNGENVVVRMVTTAECSFRIKCAYMPSSGYTVQLRFVEIMLQKGTKPTMYQDYVKHLTDALHGSTEIAGGLTMTNLLMLKNEQGEVISGMSGLTKDGENVAMWSGGTYEQALAHATAFAQHTMHELAKILPVLITKNGYGSHIGCFTIEDENTVYVENAAQTERIKIDTTDGIIISTRASRTGTYVDKVRISGNKIDKLSILGESLYGQFNVGERIVTGAGTSANYTKVMSQLNLSGGVGNWDAAFQADRLYITFTNGMITSWKFDSMKVYIGNKLIVNQGSYNYTVPTSEMGGATSIAVPLSTFSTIPSGVHDFKIVFTGFVVYNTTVATGEYINLGNVRITKKTGSSGQPSDYVDSSINFSNTPSKDIIEIGSNGIQVSHKNGGFVQMLNDSTDLYVRMFGLPNASGTSRRGELYMIPTTGEIKAHT